AQSGCGGDGRPDARAGRDRRGEESACVPTISASREAESTGTEAPACAQRDQKSWRVRMGARQLCKRRASRRAVSRIDSAFFGRAVIERLTPWTITMWD